MYEMKRSLTADQAKKVVYDHWLDEDPVYDPTSETYLPKFVIETCEIDGVVGLFCTDATYARLFFNGETLDGVPYVDDTLYVLRCARGYAHIRGVYFPQLDENHYILMTYPRDTHEITIDTDASSVHIQGFYVDS